MSTVPADDVGRRAVATALRRLMPLLVLMHVIAWVDRLNIGFAETEISEDLMLSSSLFGLAAGIFFVGYVLLEVPSNLILHRVGARAWIARIMITWGLIAAATALAWDGTSLVVFRFLLGFAEAGFLPGMVYFIACWFPERDRATAMGIFMTGIAIAFLAGAPISGGLLELDGILGLAGWQWLFLVEGVPAVLVGLWVLRVLPDRPADAAWLAENERAWLAAELASEERARESRETFTLRGALTDRRVLHLGLVGVCLNMTSYGVIFWITDIVERIGDLRPITVGLITAIPFVFGTLGLIVFGRGSDLAQDRRRYVVIGFGLGVVGLAGTVLLPPIPAIAASSLAAFGMLGAVPAFWGMPASLLSGRAAAGGFALINSIGVTGGLFGPVVVGVMKDATGSLDAGLLILCGVLLVGALLASRLRIDPVPGYPGRSAVAPDEARLVASRRRA